MHNTTKSWAVQWKGQTIDWLEARTKTAALQKARAKYGNRPELTVELN